MDEEARDFEKIVIRASSIFNSAGAVLLFLLMIAGAADVIGRYLFNAPINGTMERGQLILAMMVFLSWGHTQLKKGHVNVELFHSHFPPRLKNLSELVTTLITLAMFILLIWQSFIMALETHKSGEVVYTVHWPLAPFQLFVPLGGSIFCLVLILDIIQIIRQWKRRS